MTGRRYRYQNPALLGTVVDFSFEVGGVGDHDDDDVADRAGAHLLAEVVRLQAIFNVFDPDSQLSRWCRGEWVESESDGEFSQLMAQALRWQRLTGGLFNPLTGELSVLWAEAEVEGREPAPGRLAAMAGAIATPRFNFVDGHPQPDGDCSRFNLNAMAKGYIVDRALSATGARFGLLDNLLVNAGGDLCHRGSGRARVGIENPGRPYDNEPPLTVIEIGNEAVATSGATRRGFQVGDRRLGHVLDPRTGQTAEGSAQATIVAPSAMVADVVATSALILPSSEAVVFLDDLAATTPLAGLIIDHDGGLHPTSRWRERFGP